MIGENDILSNYRKLRSYKKVSLKLGISKYFVGKCVKKNNAVVPCGGRNKNILDNDFFANNSVESFYWAGFIAADGSVVEDKRCALSSLCISCKDSGHLEKFKKCLCFSGKINKYTNQSNNTMYTIRTMSKKIINDLCRFNIVPRKTHIYTFPGWLTGHPLVNHFMRGYSDGDGCFYVHKKSSQLGFSVAGTEDFVSNYSKILTSECGTKRDKKICKKHNTFSINYCGNRLVPIIRDFLYSGSTNDTRMTRKYLLSHLHERSGYKTRSVIGINIATGEKIVFSSIKEAVSIIGCNRTCVTDCCKGRQKTHKGFRWKYDDM